MARLNPDNLANLLAIEPASPDFRPAAVSPAIEPFDLFLRRAGRPAEPVPNEQRLEPRQPSTGREQDSRDPVRPQETEPHRVEGNSSEPVDNEGPRRESSEVSESSTDVDPNAPEDSGSEADATSPDAEAEGESDNQVDQADEKTDAEVAPDPGTEGEEEDVSEGVEFAVAALADDPVDIELAGPPGDGEETARAEEDSDGKEDGQAKKQAAVPFNSLKATEADSTEPIAGHSDEPVQSRAEAQLPEELQADSSIEKRDETQRQRAASADDEPELVRSVQPSNDEPGTVRSETAEPDALVGDDLAAGDNGSSTSERKPRGESRQKAGRQVAAAATGQPSPEAATGASESDVSVVSAVERVDLRAEQTPSNSNSNSNSNPVDWEPSAGQVAETAGKTTSGGKSEAEPVVGRVGSNENTRSTAPSGEKSSGVNQSDRVRFVQRVTRAFQSIGDGGGSVRLRLHPPELGSLSVEITVRNGLLAARLEAETSAARTMLLDNLPALRERLAEHDIKVDSFDVDLMDRSPNDSPQRPDDQAPSDDGFGDGDRSSDSGRENEMDDPRQARAVAQRGEGSQLDVVV